MGKSKTTVMELNPNSALKAFFRDPAWMAKTGFGGICYVIATIIFVVNPLLFPLSVLVISFATGYLLKVIRTKANETKSNLPDFSDPLSILFSGLSWLGIQFSFGSVLLLTFVSMLTGAQIMPENMLSLYLSIGTFLLLALATFINLLTCYLMVNLSVKDNVSAGLAIHYVLQTIKKNPKNMLLAWLLTIAIQTITVLPAATVVGLAIIPYTIFAGQLISCLLLVQVWPEN